MKVVRIIRKSGGSGGLRKNRWPLIVFCGTLRYLLPLIFAGFSAPHSLFQHLWTLALVDMSMTTHPLWFFLSISVLSLSLYCFGMLGTDGQSTDVFFSLFLSFSLLSFPFFYFYFWFPSSCCCFFFLSFSQEDWIWAVILSEYTSELWPSGLCLWQEFGSCVAGLLPVKYTVILWNIITIKKYIIFYFNIL